MLAALAGVDLAWDRVGVWQVDERVAPDGDPDRNANHLTGFPGTHHLMPVTAADLDRACARYAETLPERFDIIHLGMGPDGHTASWPPGDPVIDSERPVALSGEYQGRVRMTLTPGVVNAARSRVVLIMGADKADAVAVWLDGGELPIARVRRTGTIVVLDPPAGQRPLTSRRWTSRRRRDQRTSGTCSPPIPAAPSATSSRSATCASTTRSSASTTP